MPCADPAVVVPWGALCVVGVVQEAIAHEYFEDIHKEATSSTGNLAALLRLSSSGDLAALDQEGAAAMGAVAAAGGGGAAGGSLQHQVSQALEAELERQQHGDEDMDDWEGVCGTSADA